MYSLDSKIYEELGLAFTFFAYLNMYKVTIIVPIIKATTLSPKPSIKLTPAAFEAITTEKGFTVEAIQPI